jgi:hypothetical protein
MRSGKTSLAEKLKIVNGANPSEFHSLRLKLSQSLKTTQSFTKVFAAQHQKMVPLILTGKEI